MRALAVALLFVVTLFAGCLAEDRADDAALQVAAAPEGAVLQDLDGGLAYVFEAVELPFTTTFKLPEGATMVRFVADPLDTASIGVAMWNDETGRRRCNQQSVVGLGAGFAGERTCSSLAAIDPPGTTWAVRATASTGGLPVSGPLLPQPTVATADVRIEFLTGPVDGPAALLDLSQLSHATHELRPTTASYVDSFDGTPLWVEVTLPEGEGPWPTVIAASPYNGQSGRLQEGEGAQGGSPAMWTYWTQDWAKRGYAAVNVDVRGFGKSGGCVEVWGEKEQQDQAFIVDWVAEQTWSDGKVGFYGQSYVGTTPVAAAVQAPDALKAIIAVAPVISSYDDWHYGGVPNGESSLSPVAYQVITDLPGQGFEQGNPTTLAALVENSAKGLCDPSLIPRANDPRAIYNEFYAERDFKARAGDVTAAVLFTQGFEDANVKSAMIPGWFNELESPKLGVFGHWLHQHPARMDAEVLFLGWMEEHVKGKDLGFSNFPQALISAETDMHRVADAWPPLADERAYGWNLDEGTFVDGAGAGHFRIVAAPEVTGSITGTLKLTKDTPIVAPALRVSGTIDGDNAFLYATLTELRGDGSSRLLSYGLHNIAHRDDHTSYTPGATAPDFDVVLQFRPTEFIAEAGSTLHVRLQAASATASTGIAPPEAAAIMFHGEGSALLLHDVPLAAYTSKPLTAIP